MTELEFQLLQLSEGKSVAFAAEFAALIPQIIKLLIHNPQLINVNQDLPNPDVAVWCIQSNGEAWVFERAWAEDGWLWARYDNSLEDAYTNDDYQITHWMPLPKQFSNPLLKASLVQSLKEVS